MNEKKQDFSERIAYIFKYIFILILVVGIIGTFVVGGIQGIGQGIGMILGGNISNNFAEAYGDGVSDYYYQAVIRNSRECSQKKTRAELYSCASQEIRKFKESSYLANELGLDISEQLLINNLSKSIKNNVLESSATDPQLMGQTPQELEITIAHYFSETWNSTPLQFKKDRFFSPSRSSIGYTGMFLLKSGTASQDDYNTKLQAKRSVVDLKILAFKQNDLQKEIKKTIVVTPAEIKAEFNKKVKAKKKKEEADKKKAAKDNKDKKNKNSKNKKKVNKKSAPALKFDKAQKKAIKNQLLFKKAQEKVNKIKAKIKKWKEKANFNLKSISALTKFKIKTVKDLSLWDIDQFESVEKTKSNPKDKKGRPEFYSFPDSEEFAKLFLTAKIGKTYGPVISRGLQYYIQITKRDLNGSYEISDDDAWASLKDKDMTTEEKEEAIKMFYFRQNHNIARYDTLLEIAKSRSNYVQLRKLALKN